MSYPGKRVCQVIRVKPERLEEYIEIHKQIPPSVQAGLRANHIQNYSINYCEPLSLLIATFNYTGSDWKADSEAMRTNPENHAWWQLTDSMQESMVPGSSGSTDPRGWWLDLNEVFRFEA